MAEKEEVVGLQASNASFNAFLIPSLRVKVVVCLDRGSLAQFRNALVDLEERCSKDDACNSVQFNELTRWWWNFGTSSLSSVSSSIRCSLSSTVGHTRCSISD